VLIELAIVKLCRPQMENNYEAILNRLAVLEEQVARGVTAAPARTVSTAVTTEETEEEAKSLPPAQAKDVQAVVAQWGKITSGLEVSMITMLKSAMVSAGPDNQIILGFHEEMQKAYFDAEGHRMAVEKAVSEQIGKEIHIVPKLLEKGRAEEALFINPNKIHLEHVEFIDEDQF
jgi:DNA polymerase-3 subunit gamma/tau